MATRMKCDAIPGMKVLYNLSDMVGPGKPNKPDDVMLVQVLLADMAAAKKIGHLSAVMGPPAITGTFDFATAYWILLMQHENRAGVKVDGFVSPCKSSSGTYSGDTKAWLIAAMNAWYYKHLAQKFSALPTDSRLSPALRKAIAP